MLYYAAPVESLDGILREGILTPGEVRARIRDGRLKSDVLGVSYNGLDTSNFPDHVSLVSDHRTLNVIAQQMSFARTGNYYDHNFRALVFSVDPAIRLHPEFVEEAKVKSMNPDAYHSEVLYAGTIARKFIHDEQSCVRPRI